MALHYVRSSPRRRGPREANSALQLAEIPACAGMSGFVAHLPEIPVKAGISSKRPENSPVD